ncbi:MAG: class I SAM-dependent methyltransferase [Pelagibacteraceae bacterium]|nr:class I SAM-dependent methyltransferase [Pelagibacteraceae bacterium]PHX89366.1 MAG: SAM-dependent methyltransferase [Pelagibacteraceae bacterium]
MSGLKNWDNKTWVSSANYIKSFTRFILKQNKLNRDSKILDIGCGRGKIIANISTKIRLKNKPIGIDLENNSNIDKRIIFKKINALYFLKYNKKNFDLILIKQTIHLLKIKEILKLLNLCKKSLTPNGKIFILSLDSYKNELPVFTEMKKKLIISLNRNKKIIDLILKANPKTILKKYVFKTKIYKKKYINMIRKKYISILLNLNSKQIEKGVNEINFNYKKVIKFNDKLVCLIIKK